MRGNDSSLPQRFEKHENPRSRAAPAPRSEPRQRAFCQAIQISRVSRKGSAARSKPPQNAPAFLKHGVASGPPCASKGVTARFIPPIFTNRGETRAPITGRRFMKGSFRFGVLVRVRGIVKLTASLEAHDANHQPRNGARVSPLFQAQHSHSPGLPGEWLSKQDGGRKRAVTPSPRHGGSKQTHRFTMAGAFWGGAIPFNTLTDIRSTETTDMKGHLCTLSKF